MSSIFYNLIDLAVIAILIFIALGYSALFVHVANLLITKASVSLDKILITNRRF